MTRTGVSPADILESLAVQTLGAAEAGARRLGVKRIEVKTGWGGRGQLAGLLLGSVSQKLVSLAPCPVLVVP